VQGEDDWMSQFFFSGGMMPSDDLPLHFQQHLKLKQRWRWNGRSSPSTRISPNPGRWPGSIPWPLAATPRHAWP